MALYRCGSAMPLYALIVFIHKFFSEIAGAFTVTARRKRGNIHILERDGVADPNSHS
jgi:cytochrome c biogenesis protein CcdA